MGQRLGQHFLISTSILDRIARAACGERADTVVEIGPGRGALTSYLVERSERVIALEIDQILTAGLKVRFAHSGNLTVVEADVMNTDLGQWGPAVITGNLPYYITSPILDKTLTLGEKCRLAVFLVQREVAQRLVAGPGTRDYGFLSVRTQVMAEVKVLFVVPSRAFRPPPKVDSAVVRLTPRKASLVEDVPGFLKFAGVCFLHKRKNLRNNLAAAYPGLAEFEEGRLRAEQLTVSQLIELWRKLIKASA